ncbi:MAG: hypothetical protein EOP92_27175 [Lysobacteraceae bacterium]|nr:MAG: hypothetical protein EOP92_27175 [Xanthomonadaceae bacterium]
MSIAALLVGIAVSAAAGYTNYRYVRRYDGLVGRVEEEFRGLRLEAADPAMCFDGRTAAIVREQREYSDRDMRTVIRIQRYARNGHGEYFFFISEGNGRPYFKHIGHSAAKVALGSSYVPPTNAR